MRKKEKLIKLICIISITCIILASNISNANDIRWNLYFDNIEITTGSVSANQEATIIGSSRAEITFDVTLGVPGDFYEFTVDAVNDGTVDAMIDQVGINTLTEAQKKYMTYTVTYSDGMEVRIKDKLRAGTTEKLRVRLAFKDDVAPIDLPNESTAMTLVLNTSYVQADENAVDREDNTINYYNNSINNKTDNTINNYNSTSNKTDSTILVNGEDSNLNYNESDSLTKSQNSKLTNKIVQKIKSIATGDEILKYLLILALAVFAFILSFLKKDSN